MDLLTRKGRGFGADVIGAQLVCCFVSGGASLADAERLEAGPLARIETVADETTLSEWLRAQFPQSVAAGCKLICQILVWAASRVETGRWKYNGLAKLNYEVKVALS